MALKLGIYLNSQHAAGDDPARRFAETLEQVRLIRSLGFDSIWAGEHHATPGFHFFPQLPLLYRLAEDARFESSQIGGNVRQFRHRYQIRCFASPLKLRFVCHREFLANRRARLFSALTFGYNAVTLIRRDVYIPPPL